MNLRSAKIHAEFENQVRQERLNNKKNNVSKVNSISSKAGLVSQQKLDQILGKHERAQLTETEAQSSNPPHQTISQPVQVDNRNGIFNPLDNSSFSNEILKEAVDRLIKLNKDKLSDSQLVDLVSSFYFVTNQSLKQCNTNAVDSAVYTPVMSQTTENGNVHQTEFSDEYQEQPKVFESLKRPLTLLERKRLQWLQDNEELERLGKDRAFSAVEYPTMAEGVKHHRDKGQCSAPPVKDYHRFKRCNYLSGLPVGEDPRAEAEMKEQKRRQWLADLDQQIEERRIARERERLKNLTLDSAPPRGSQEIDSSLTASASFEVKSTGYGRGRGLANLMERQESESASKRQQQQELKEVYAEQIRERNERRQKEREAEAKADAAVEEAVRLEIERERRLNVEQELKLAQLNRQAELEAQERAFHKVAENNKKPPLSVNQHASRSVSRIPCPSNRPASQTRNKPNDLEKVKKTQFGSTYTISNPAGKSDRGSINVRTQNLSKKETPAVVRTESTLMSSKPLPPNFPSNRPISDFLSAIADPDFAFPQETRDSALLEVSKMKENLAQRRNELKSMQQNY